MCRGFYAHPEPLQFLHSDAAYSIKQENYKVFVFKENEVFHHGGTEYTEAKGTDISGFSVSSVAPWLASICFFSTLQFS